MKMKIMLTALLAMVAVSPLTSVLRADSGGWSTITANAAWDYGTHRVERLAFADDALAPLSLGDAVFVLEPVDSCKPSDCDRYDFYLLDNGTKLLFSNIPAEAMDALRFGKNDERFVYMNPIDENATHFSVIERDLEDGTATTLVDDVFFSGVVSVDALVDGTDTYFNPSFNYNGSTSVEQAGVYFWNAAERQAKIIGTHWELREESLEDAQDGVALVKMSFDDGYEQLWFGDTHNVNNLGMTREAIPGTWTEPTGDIVGAHFLSDGSIEYFQYFVRYTYNPDVDTTAVKHDELLSWYVPTEEAYQIVGNRMAWIDAEQNLYVSDDGVVTHIGQAAWNKFLLEEDRLFYGVNVEVPGTGLSTTLAGKMYDFNTKTTTDTDYFVADTAGSSYVGIVPNTYTGVDAIYYMNAETGASVYLGFGTNAVISDENHVYWQGTDGAIYEATILPSAAANTSVRAMKLATEKTVYLIEGDTRKAIPNEEVYMSWFDTWASVETVSSTTLNTYTSAGSAKFAPGTKVKFEGDAKVYVVGEDEKIHWLTSQTVAFDIYGASWNQDIVTVSIPDMVDYASGDAILTERDIESI